MRALSALRPVQIIDVSFQLMRHNFAKSYMIALLVTSPLQAVIWILQVALGDIEDGGVVARTVLLIFILQFFAFGASMCIVSNFLSGVVGKAYSQQMFGHTKITRSLSTRITIGLWQFFLQLCLVFSTITVRYVLTRALDEASANLLAYLFFFCLSVPWVIITLRTGFLIPVSTHEGGTFSSIRNRAQQINKTAFFQLFGIHLMCIVIITSLVTPSLSTIQLIIANNVIESDLGFLAYMNVIFALVIALVSVVYSYVLTVTYFNARIKNEGFDIALNIVELENERNERGKLLRSIS